MVDGSNTQSNMRHVYPKHIAAQKKAHELRMTVTEQDELYYKPPVPLTEKQKEEILHEEDKKRVFILSGSKGEESLEVENPHEWYDSQDPNENKYD